MSSTRLAVSDVISVCGAGWALVIPESFIFAGRLPYVHYIFPCSLAYITLITGPATERNRQSGHRAPGTWCDRPRSQHLTHIASHSPLAALALRSMQAQRPPPVVDPPLLPLQPVIVQPALMGIFSGQGSGRCWTDRWKGSCPSGGRGRDVLRTLPFQAWMIPARPGSGRVHA